MIIVVAQLLKNPPATQETWVRSLGWEDPLEKEKATHSSILAWRIPWRNHGITGSWTWLSDFDFTIVLFNQWTYVELCCFSSVQFSLSVMSNSLWPSWLCHRQLPEFTQTHVCWIDDAIQQSHPLSSLLLLPSIFPSIRVFSNESVLRIRFTTMKK